MVTIDVETRFWKGWFSVWMDDKWLFPYAFVQCEPHQSSEIPLPSGPVLRSGVLQSSFEALPLDNIRIGQLLIDRINDITIFFVITLNGFELRKYSLINHELCLLEQIQLKPTTIPDNQWKINQAEFLSERVINKLCLIIVFLITFDHLFRRKLFLQQLFLYWNFPLHDVIASIQVIYV